MGESGPGSHSNERVLNSPQISTTPSGVVYFHNQDTRFFLSVVGSRSTLQEIQFSVFYARHPTGRDNIKVIIKKYQDRIFKFIKQILMKTCTQLNNLYDKMMKGEDDIKLIVKKYRDWIFKFIKQSLMKTCALLNNCCLNKSKSILDTFWLAYFSKTQDFESITPTVVTRSSSARFVF